MDMLEPKEFGIDDDDGNEELRQTIKPTILYC